MELGLSGKRAIITGGTRGIGRAILEAFVTEGAQVAFCARGKDGVDETVETVSVRGTVYGKALDAADDGAVQTWVAEAADQLEGIDIVVGNASGTGGSSSSSETAFLSHLRVDLLSFARTMEAALPYMRASDAASAVSIASTVAVEHFGAGACAFNAMKAALVNYTAGLSQNLASENIRVNVVSPGPIFVEGGGWDRVRNAKPEFYEATERNIPLGRFGTPEEVARVVVFLASPAASFVTGENVVIDGGLTKRVPY